MTMRATSANLPMVGRDAELSVLRDALAAGRAGSPRVVVVRGEAGIGKTRLLQEFLSTATATAPLPVGPPVVVAVGQCVDMGEIGGPFTPIRRLLRDLYATVGDEAFRAAAQTPTVIATLGLLLPELTPDASVAPPDTGPDYITEAIERVIEGLSHDHHLVLVIEDLHWADAATLALVKTLAVTLRGAHVTVVMTYRSDDVGRSHPLRPILSELDRNRTVTGVEVTRLSPAETRELARAVAGPTRTRELETVVARSDGIPFFVEELVELEDRELPATLRDLVLARYERLGTAAQEAVRLVAAGGLHIDNALLEDAHEGDRDALRTGLREALAANVLVSDDAGYAFRHALIQEAVRDELLPSERAELHGRYAAALQQRVDDGRDELAAEAAEHWLQARDLPRAFDAIVVARRHAQSTWAPITAARLGERLLELWSQVPDSEARSTTTRTQLYVDTANAWRAQDGARALRLARAGLAVASDAEQLGRALLLLEAATAEGNAGRITESLQALDNALLLLDEDDPGHTLVRARALGLKATLPASALGGDAVRQHIAEDALAAAERSGDPGLLATCLVHISWRMSDIGELDDALSTIRRALALDLPADRRLHATITELDALVRLGRFDEAATIAERAAALALDVGLDRSMGALIASNRAEALISYGAAAEGESVARRCVDLLAGVPTFRSFGLRLLTLAASWDDRADDAERIRQLERVDIEAIQAEDAEERIGWAEYDTEAALNRAETEMHPATIADLTAAALAAALTLDDEDLLQQPGTSRRILPAAARALADADLLGLDESERTRLRRAVDASVASQPDDGPGHALAALARAEATRASGDGEAEAWRGAIDLVDEGLVPVRFRHYARYRLAGALIIGGDRDAASSLLTLLIAEAPADGVAVAARWGRALAARAALVIDETNSDSRAARNPGATNGAQPLTPRELQVLRLVAEGLTNPQIGARLFISPKTASVHVSAILAKIGAANRTEAAARYRASGGA